MLNRGLCCATRPAPMLELSRRRLLKSAVATVLAAQCQNLWGGEEPPARQASGVKIGEMTSDRAVIWTRLTRFAARNDPRRYLNIEGRWDRHAPPPPAPPSDTLAGACPGAPGRIRIRHGLRDDLADARATEWISVGPATDYTHRFELHQLTPDRVHYFAVETLDELGHHGSVRGRFRTAPEL